MWPRSAPGPLLPSKKAKHRINYQHRHRKYSRINRSDQNESQRFQKATKFWVKHQSKALWQVSPECCRVWHPPWSLSSGISWDSLTAGLGVGRGIRWYPSHKWLKESASDFGEFFMWKLEEKGREKKKKMHLSGTLNEGCCRCHAVSNLFFREKIRKASHKYKPFFIQAIAFGEALANAGSRKVRYCWKCCNDQSVSGFGSSLPRGCSPQLSLHPRNLSTLRCQLLHPRWIWPATAPTLRCWVCPSRSQPRSLSFSCWLFVTARSVGCNRPAQVRETRWALARKYLPQRKVVGKVHHIDMSQLQSTFRENGIDLGNSGCALLKRESNENCHGHMQKLHWWIWWARSPHLLLRHPCRFTLKSLLHALCACWLIGFLVKIYYNSHKTG